MNNLQRFLNQEILENLEELIGEDHPRRMREAENPFEELTANGFIQIYRLTKERVTRIIDIVRQYEPPPSRRSALDVPRKVLTALRFLGAGSYQMDVGLGVYSNMSQPSVSRSLRGFIDVFNRPEIFQEYVRFHRNIAEVREARNRFLERFNFPHTIGCIDCKHVAIVPPTVNHPIHPEHVYVNRKGYHSLNVQLICDADFKILNINSRYPGSVNDCTIWNDSEVQVLMRRIHNYEDERFYLIGDGGYPLRSWLMTPYQNPADGSRQAAFNASFCRARSIIERVNGILKMRFRCLLKQRVLHYDPTTAAKIANTCAIVHNMAISDGYRALPGYDEIWRNNPDFGLLPEEELEDEDIPARVNPELAAGRSLRNRICARWFA